MFQEIKDAQIKKLEFLISELKTITVNNWNFCRIDFNLQNFHNVDLGIFENGKKYLYFFELDTHISSEEEDNFLSLHGNISIARKNKNDSSSYILYVGSSKNLKRRFQEHCGFGSQKTYSLQLLHWINKNRNITFQYLEIDSENQEILQILEDGLWDNLKPIFGKRGAR